MSERLWAVRVSVAALCLAVLSAGCSGTILAPSPSPPNGVEQLPAPAYMHITGHPAVAATRLTIAYVLPDGSVPSRGDVVEAGQEIDVSRTSQPGTHQLLINGTRCSGAFELQGQMIVDLVIRVDGGRCEATVVGIRAEAEPGPAGARRGQVKQGLTIAVTSLQAL